MNEERITEILSKIKNTVGENNYKLALAITGHRPGKIRDVVMSSKDGELLLEYITKLQNNWNELKKWLESWLENDKHCYLAENPIDKCRCEVYKELLNKMQELEQVKDE